MSWATVINTAIAAVALALSVYNTMSNRGIRKSERGSASLEVTIREFTRKPYRKLSGWNLSEQQLVIDNYGPGDAREVVIDATFPEHHDGYRASFELVGPVDLPIDVAAGRMKRFGCCVVEQRSDDDWDSDAVPFPVELVVSWRDGSGLRTQTFPIDQPEVEEE